MELDDCLHHAHSLVHWAVEVKLRERVLLQEFVLDDLSSLNTALVTQVLTLRIAF